MLAMQGYNVITEIFNGRSSIIYRAVEEESRSPVIIKLLKKEYPSPEELAKFEYEYSVANSLRDINGIIQNREIAEYHHTKAIIMEDFDANSMDKVLEKGSLDLPSFLFLAIEISRILMEIHKRNIIHKDIKPHNILFNEKEKIIKLIDFGISSQSAKEIQSIINPDQLEGTLAYISPEQTGRMNRSIDYRTDLYSLGVTFYQVLTRRLPFASQDPMELVHSHIAREPLPPRVISPEIPEMISRIILKLMEKNAEDRYQSAAGLIYDLEKCRRRLEKYGAIDDFTLGTKDISNRFQISEKIYGRDAEISFLLNLFQETSRGNQEIVYISGDSGIGKTVLINEIHKPMVEKRGYFISGKYDLLKKNTPHGAIIQAFQNLIQQLLTENNYRIEKWKKSILAALGNNGSVLTGVIPELELIIGPQPEVPPLPPDKSRNRFHMVFQNFIKVIATENHPLVLFLDDLQWADNASFTLMENLFSDMELKYFLFLGAFRQNEINKTHPLAMSREKIAERNIKYQDLNIGPLGLEELTSLLRETFKTRENTEELARIILSKTGGNPFFVVEFLKTLYSRELIKFENHWCWELEKIDKADITDNVVTLTAEKILTLPNNALKLLKIISCMGTSCSLTDIASICGKNEQDCIRELQIPMKEGLIITIENNITFIHDKIREATYSLIEKEERRMFHYKIGIFLLNRNSAKHKDSLFQIVNQLNKALELLKEEEKELLIGLNIKAGKKAQLSTAYSSGKSFLKTAESLLAPDSWETNYERTFSLYLELAETEFLLTNYTEAKKILSDLMKKTTDPLNRCRLSKIRINCLTAENKPFEAIPEGLEAARLLGVNLPMEPDPHSLGPEMTRIMEALERIDDQDLLNSPVTDDRKIIEVGNLFVSINAMVYQNMPALFPFLALKIVSLSLEHGIFETTSFGFAMYALLIQSMGKRVDARNKAEIALQIAHKFPNGAMKSFCSFIRCGTLSPFEHPREVIKKYKEAFQLAVEAGDIEYSSYSIYYIPVVNIAAGTGLKTIKEELDQYSTVLYSLHQEGTNLYFNAYRQFVENIFTEKDHIHKLKGGFFDEDIVFGDNKFLSDINLIFHYSFPRVLLNYLFGRYRESMETIKIIEQNELTFAGQPYALAEKLLFSLTYAALYQESDENTRQNILETLMGYLEYFSEMTDYNYNLHRNKRDLLAAEISRITNSPVKIVTGKNSRGEKIFEEKQAIELYDMAISGARKNGFTQEEAFANECAAWYYLSRRAKTAASAYMTKARYCYVRWGCQPKVDQLDGRYPDLLASVKFSGMENNSITGTISIVHGNTLSSGSGSSTGGSLLDLGTVMKASYALSGEIEMSSLLSKMIKILIENAGARKGMLILPDKEDRLFIEASVELEKDEPQVLQSVPINQSTDLSPAIVRYVSKTKETVVLDDASKDPAYAGDEYIKKNHPRSVLCTAIINQGKLAALLYLENNLTTGAFTAERVDILNLLSTQAAISLKNALLVEEMKEKERLKQELAIAERIQTAIVPPAPEHEELEIAVSMSPAEKVGGDYYDIITDKEGKLWFAIGDVTGHGLTSGLIMMMAQTAFCAEVKNYRGKTPGEVMDSVNRVITWNIRNRLKVKLFMTITFFKYLGDGRFSYTGAHDPPMVYRKSTNKIEILKLEGVYMGIKPEISYSIKEEILEMGKEDILILYTDGVMESHKAGDRRNLFGRERFQEIMAREADKSAETILQSLRTAALDWCNRKPADDITLIVIKRKK